MSNGIQNSSSIKHHMKQQMANRNGPITRKSNREQMHSTKLLQLSFPSPQKKGRQNSDQLLESFELERESVWSPTSLNPYNDSDLFSPTALSPTTPENLSESDHQIRKEAKKAVEFEANLVGFQIGLLKDGCKKKVESLRRVKIEVKEELSEVREKCAEAQHQVGFNEGKAEFLARENEELKRQLAKALESLNSIQERSTVKKKNANAENGKKSCNQPKKQATQKNNRFVCVFCDRAFSIKATLRDHVRTHTGEKPHRCKFCDKRFTQWNQLNTHLRGHTGERPFKCSLCGLSFSLQATLKNHCLTHTGERPYKCEFCGKRFTQMNHLQAHRRIHTGERPYKCSLCGLSFSTQTILKNHRLTHEGERERPHKCDFCNKSFTQKSQLKTHLLTAHTEGLLCRSPSMAESDQDQ